MFDIVERLFRIFDTFESKCRLVDAIKQVFENSVCFFEFDGLLFKSGNGFSDMFFKKIRVFSKILSLKSNEHFKFSRSQKIYIYRKI